MKTFLVIFAVVMNLLLLDVASKEAALKHLSHSEPVVVIDGLFNLALVKNRGCAWGMLQGQVWPLVAANFILLAVVAWKRKAVFNASGVTVAPKAALTLARTAECLFYAGALGNMLDRAFRGFVVDMLDFHWGAHHFPCFNLADTYLTIAVLLLLALSFLRELGVRS